MSAARHPRCRCGAAGLFGYEVADDRFEWFCAKHRLRQWYADECSDEAEADRVLTENGMSMSSTFDEHLQRMRKPDGQCFHCRRPANRHYPVGPITISVSEPYSGDEIFTHEFCRWECFGQWAAVQAGGVFIVGQS
jgi:hypothetical protein